MPDAIDHDGRRAAAVRVALRSGLLRACPADGEVYDPGRYDYQGARMLAAHLINSAAPDVAPFGGDRAALTALLMGICAGYPTACPRCHPAAPA